MDQNISGIITVTRPSDSPSDSAVVVLYLGDKGTLRLSVRDGVLVAFGGGSAEVDALLNAINR